MLATAASLFFIEKLGRRPLRMSWPLPKQSLSSASPSVRKLEATMALIPGLLATVCISLYPLAFKFGWVSIPWLFPAEVNSLSMRTKGAALATAMDWLFN
jgi:hypothetical protein